MTSHYFDDPDHASRYFNEDEEEICPECEQLLDDCECRTGYVDEPDLPELEET